jgi:Arc/MetJ-type ribon-helix-helix transcriptional regulator
MANMVKISISLPSEMVGWLRDAVDRGDYATISDAVRDALRMWIADQRASRLLSPKKIRATKRTKRRGRT